MLKKLCFAAGEAPLATIHWKNENESTGITRAHSTIARRHY